MTMLLHLVTGTAENCAPCAWSALTGLSSNTWPDKPMTDNDEFAVLEKQRFENGAPWYVVGLPDHLAGGGLGTFREQGRWALTVAWDGDDERHAVAVAVFGSECVLADNHIRDPLPVAAVIEKHEKYRTAKVVSGFQLVPDTAVKFRVENC